MIDCKELRIGNWYFFDNPMNSDKSEFEQFANWTQALDFEAYGEPIPLSPELLIKCGFELDTKVWWLHPELIGCELLDNSPREEAFSLTFDKVVIGLTSIKYLHQLQNLYYVLTQKELNIQL